MQAPFPYFGGKSMCSDAVWRRFGRVRNYVEPFFGSGAMLLNRPLPFEGTETVNDKSGFVANFWRAVSIDPESVAFHADHPVNENDLHARHSWLLQFKETLAPQLEGDPEWFDAKVAGWWCWGMCCWIGSGFCSGNGPWHVVDGQLVHLGNAGRGVNRQLVHLGNAGQGVNRQLVHLGPGGNGMQTTKVGDNLYLWMQQLCDRLRKVRVCCGDWSRVCGDTPTVKQGETAVFLDPPYADTADRTADLYEHDCLNVAHECREWAIANGERMRICLAGYEGEHTLPDDWECVHWKAKGGYGSQAADGNDNCRRERLWFSPRCLRPKADRMLFEEASI